jgi:hypothetical protein
MKWYQDYRILWAIILILVISTCLGGWTYKSLYQKHVLLQKQKQEVRVVKDVRTVERIVRVPVPGGVREEIVRESTDGTTEDTRTDSVIADSTTSKEEFKKDSLRFSLGPVFDPADFSRIRVSAQVQIDVLTVPLLNVPVGLHAGVFVPLP